MDEYFDLEDYLKNGPPLRNSEEYEALKAKIEESAYKNYMTGHPRSLPEVVKTKNDWIRKGCPLPEDYHDDAGDVPHRESEMLHPREVPDEYYIRSQITRNGWKHYELRTRSKNRFVDFGANCNKKQDVLNKRWWNKYTLYFKNKYVKSKYWWLTTWEKIRRKIIRKK